MLGRGATRLGQIAAVKPDTTRTDVRHEHLGALLSLVLRPPHTIPHESGKPQNIGMRETFECSHLGTQHTCAIVLEPLWNSNDLVGLRIHYLVFDANFYLERLVGLQLRHNSLLERKRLHAPQARIGTKKRIRDNADDQAHAKACAIPNPETANGDVYCTSDFIAVLNSYTDNGQYPLAIGDLKSHLVNCKGSASALELLDANASNAKSRGGAHRGWHAAAPDVLFGLSRSTLAANLGHTDEMYAQTRHYMRLSRAATMDADCGFRLPKPDECFMLVPSSRQAAMETPFPEAIFRAVDTQHLLNGQRKLPWREKRLEPLKPLIKKPKGKKKACSTTEDESEFSESNSSSDSE